MVLDQNVNFADIVIAVKNKWGYVLQSEILLDAVMLGDEIKIKVSIKEKNLDTPDSIFFDENVNFADMVVAVKNKWGYVLQSEISLESVTHRGETKIKLSIKKSV